jgi:SAM-dependent methyltransferase
MIRKNNDSNYYDVQNGRSGMMLDSNEIVNYLYKIPLEFSEKLNVLDIGCRAHCNAVRYFHKRGMNSFGFDIGENAKLAWDNCEFKNNLKIHDAHNKFPYDVKFDLITISHTLEHCHTPEVVLKNIYDSLNTGGVVFGVVPVEAETDNHAPHYCMFTDHVEHVDMYKSAGFTVVEDWCKSNNSYIIAVKNVDL